MVPTLRTDERELVCDQTPASFQAHLPTKSKQKSILFLTIDRLLGEAYNADILSTVMGGRRWAEVVFVEHSLYYRLPIYTVAVAFDH